MSGAPRDRLAPAGAATVRLVVEPTTGVLRRGAGPERPARPTSTRRRAGSGPDSGLSIANARAGRPTTGRPCSSTSSTPLSSAAEPPTAPSSRLGLAMQRIGYDRDIAAVPGGDRPVAHRRPLHRRVAVGGAAPGGRAC